MVVEIVEGTAHLLQVALCASGEKIVVVCFLSYS
jgi:hypothetical protein